MGAQAKILHTCKKKEIRKRNASMIRKCWNNYESKEAIFANVGCDRMEYYALGFCREVYSSMIRLKFELIFEYGGINKSFYNTHTLSQTFIKLNVSFEYAM